MDQKEKKLISIEIDKSVYVHFRKISIESGEKFKNVINNVLKKEMGKKNGKSN